MRTGPNYKCCPSFNGETKEIPTGGGKHRFKQVCISCGHFIKWIPDPSITEKVNERKKQITSFIEQNKDKINGKHLEFLNTMTTQRFMTPRQHLYLATLMGDFEGIAVK